MKTAKKLSILLILLIGAIGVQTMVSCSSDDGDDNNGGETGGKQVECSDPSFDPAASSNRGTFKDDRDGNVYKTVLICTQTWLAENLKYNATNSRCVGASGESGDLVSSGGRCNTYGRLYDWATAMALPSTCNGDNNSCASQVQTVHKGVCPDGWHIPSNAEWKTLVDYVGNDANKLKATSGWDWDGMNNKSGNGTDDFGFSALPGGNGYSVFSGSFAFVGAVGYWLTTEERSSNIYSYSAWRLFTSDGIGDNWGVNKMTLSSVRCIKGGGTGGGDGGGDGGGNNTDCSNYQSRYTSAKSSVERWQETLADVEDTYNFLVNNGGSQTSISSAANTVAQAKSSLRTAEENLASVQREAANAGCTVY